MCVDEIHYGRRPIMNKYTLKQPTRANGFIRKNGKHSPKISIAFDPETFDYVLADAQEYGLSFGAVVRAIVENHYPAEDL